MQLLRSLDQASTQAVDKGETYYRLSKKYYRLKAFRIVSGEVASFCKFAILGGILFLAILMLCVGAAMALGQTLGDLALGYLIVGAALLTVAAGFFLWGRKKVDQIVLRKLSKTFFED